MNLSQQELADRLSITQPSVSAWEIGTAFPDIPNLIALCNLFEVSPNDLLEWETGAEPVLLRTDELAPCIMFSDGSTEPLTKREEQIVTQILLKARRLKSKFDADEAADQMDFGSIRAGVIAG